MNITERRRADEAQKGAYEELEQRVQDRTVELESTQRGLHALSVRLMQIQDDERRRIARELHDSAGQMLAALSMNLALIEQEADQLSPERNDNLSECIGMVRGLTDELRNISHLLHPPLPDLGRLPKEMETAIFRIVQECLTNIHRHSGSSTASIRILRNSQEISVEVRDQGKGMPSASSGPLRGIGVQGMRERVREWGGMLKIRSGSGGTTVLATLPMPDRAANDRS